jgi:D-glucosaminate-6-phosphate ammonia-lyase
MIKSLSAIPFAGSVIASESLFADPFSLMDMDESQKGYSGGSLSIGPDIYQSIGVEPVINCRATLTVIGGSIKLPEVMKAMEYAYPHFVQMDELAMAVGKRLGELTGAEWGFVSAGAAAGLKHITTACVTGGDPEKLIRVPDLTGFEKTDVIFPRYSRIIYDHAVRNVGVNIITVDTPEELENAISPRTAMIFLYTGSQSFSSGPLSLENIAKIAKPANIPILVDAAAEILTIPNVHLENGATIVTYSGGKILRGPQSAGISLGDKNILLSAWQASSPQQGPGRDNKVDRMEFIGMLAAIEAWVKRDHDAIEKTWMSWLNNISNRIKNIESISIDIREPRGLNNRTASMTISWDPEVLNITGEEVAEDFAKNKPRIAIGARSDYDAGTTSISINTYVMQPGEDKIVGDRIYNILSQKHSRKSDTMEPPAGDITGFWDVAVEYNNGNAEHKICIENQDGNWLEGFHVGTYSKQDLAGTIEGNRVKLRSDFRVPGNQILFIFSGTLKDNTISGTLYLGQYLTAKFTAEKSVHTATRTRIDLPSHGRRNPHAW